MCDFIVISTNSSEDLSHLEHDTACFSKDIRFEQPLELLKYHNQYRLFEKESACGCFFRVFDPNLGMIAPQEWLDESNDNLDNTYFAYDHIKRLLSEGYQVDCISIWTGQTPDDEVFDYGTVNLDQIDRDTFAFLFQTYFNYITD